MQILDFQQLFLLLFKFFLCIKLNTYFLKPLHKKIITLYSPSSYFSLFCLILQFLIDEMSLKVQLKVLNKFQTFLLRLIQLLIVIIFQLFCTYQQLCQLSNIQFRQLSKFYIDFDLILPFQKSYNLKKIQMQEAAILKTNNDTIQNLIKNKSYSDPKLKQLLKKNKIIIFSYDNIEKAPQEFLLQALRFSQLNLLNALATNNTRQFQLAIDNTKFFYQNTFTRTRSSEYFMVTAIHLLFLLSSHKNQEYYAKIETLNSQDLSDKYIGYVLLINDAIQEGNYRKVFTLKKQSPLDYFAPFLNRISQTVRIQIAKSAEKAYSQLSVSEALLIFQLESEVELKKFIERYCESIQEHTVRWVFDNNKIFFQKANSKKIAFNADELIQTSLFYSHELQRIA